MSNILKISALEQISPHHFTTSNSGTRNKDRRMTLQVKNPNKNELIARESLSQNRKEFRLNTKINCEDLWSEKMRAQVLKFRKVMKERSEKRLAEEDESNEIKEIKKKFSRKNPYFSQAGSPKNCEGDMKECYENIIEKCDLALRENRELGVRFGVSGEILQNRFSVR